MDLQNPSATVPNSQALPNYSWLRCPTRKRPWQYKAMEDPCSSVSPWAGKSPAYRSYRADPLLKPCSKEIPPYHKHPNSRMPRERRGEYEIVGHYAQVHWEVYDGK